MPITWLPKVQTLEEEIAKELARIEALSIKREQPEAPRWEPQDFTFAPSEPSFAPEPTAWQPQAPVTPQAMPRVTLGVMPTAPAPEAPPTPEEAPQAWEMPKVYAEGAMQKVGEAISKVPILPEALQFVAPVFEWIHEKLEKPWASIITSPFSPSLPFTRGETWLEHEKREYDTWKSPTYAKGVAEFSMPFWWVPWLGWATKGAKAVGVGDKMARVLTQLPAKNLSLPSKEILNSTLYKKDFFKTAALWAENKPVIGGVVRAIGGPSAFVKDVGELYPAMDIATKRLIAVNVKNVPVAVTDVVKREVVNRAVIYDMRHGYRGLQLPRMQKYGNPVDVLQVDDFGRVMTATPKSGNELGRGLSEVFENPDLYTYASKEAESIVREGNKIIAEVMELAGKEGVKVKGKPIFHRLVEGKEVPLGDKTVYEASEYGSRFEIARHHKTMEEGIKAGVRYTKDPLRSVGATIDHYFKRISTKRFDDEVKKLGMTIPEMVALVEPQLMDTIVGLSAKIGSASYLTQALKRVTSYGGKRIPGAPMAKIKRGMPEVAERIEQAFSISPKEIDKIVSALGTDLRRATKLNPRSLKVIIAQYQRTPGKIMAREIDEMVSSLNVSNSISQKAITRAYKAVYESRKGFIDDTLKAVKGEAEQIIKSTKAELSPLKKQYNLLARPYREGKQVFGGLAKFQMHPAFKNMIFDKEVVDLAEKALGATGNQWLRNMANISGTGRLLIATMDFSAPFIQGLSVLGRNPLAWARGVGKQFEFFAKPQNLMKYLDDPAVRAISSERWFYGGSRSSFEFFEALKPVQVGVGKIPKVGEIGQRVIYQTYGRAEAAFTGFGEVARNEMWKALRSKAIKNGVFDDAAAREIARTIDRMTGVMSVESLAIGRTQSEFENAFVFFAPRYTRAGLSYVADVMKGGIAGAEARKSLGALMASGMAMYYGVTTALGQKPNLDINSSRFMTVKIGDDYVGIGGILYGLGRLTANVVGTAIEEPVDFLSLSRFDNPFIKFMFSRTAPLTGLTVGAALEQKNYFGEPLESIGDWGKFFAEKVLPIAAQRAILEPEHRAPSLFISEVMGGRTFPKSAWELQEDEREVVAQREFGAPYEQLDLLKRKQVDQFPEVTRFQEEIDKRTTQRGKALSVAFLERGRDLDDARFMHKSNIEQLQRAYDAGVINGYEFKEGVTEANVGYGATYEHINQNTRYTEVVAKLEEPRDVSRQYRWELAYDELMEATTSNRFEDIYGIFDFTAYNNFLEDLRIKYGDDDYNQALEMRNEKYAEYPPMFQELQRAKQVLKSYWQVQEEAIKIFGQPRTKWQENRLNAFISKIRKQKRLASPEVEKYIQLFYSRT